LTGEFAVAVHALVFLNHKKATLSSEAISKNVCTNPARVRKVMAKLKKSGLVSTKEGADGGYLFIRNPNDVTLREICEAVEAKAVTSARHSGDTDKQCLIASGMADVMDSICKSLDESCKQELENITITDIERKIFKNE